MKTITAVATGLLVLMCAACSSNEPTAAPLPPTNSGHSTPAAASKPSLSGIGATDADWNAHHTADSSYESGAAYDPDPSLPNVNGRAADKYYGVLHDGGRVTGYSVRYKPGTSEAEALVAIKAEFPGDAVLVWKQDKATCGMAQFKSATLGRALGNEGGVLVSFTTSEINGGDGYSPSSADDANLLNLYEPSIADAPEC